MRRIWRFCLVFPALPDHSISPPRSPSSLCRSTSGPLPYSPPCLRVSGMRPSRDRPGQARFQRGQPPAAALRRGVVNEGLGKRPYSRRARQQNLIYLSASPLGQPPLTSWKAEKARNAGWRTAVGHPQPAIRPRMAGFAPRAGRREGTRGWLAMRIARLEVAMAGFIKPQSTPQ